MHLQRLAGLSGISIALIYIAAFIYFGGFWHYPSDGSIADKINYLAANQHTFSIMYLLMYVVFGVVLCVLVVGLHERLVRTQHSMILVGSVFGVIWVGLVIASGMISTIGLAYVLEYSHTNMGKAYDVWKIISLLTESIGGGNELVGGLWVLLVSCVALKGRVFSNAVNYLGCLVGLAGIATVYPAEILTMIFGLTQIVWFIWIGIALIKDDALLN